MFKEPVCVRSFWRFYQFDRKLESYYNSIDFEIIQFRHIFGNIYWMKFRKRFNNFLPLIDQPCDWCNKITSTSYTEIWSELFPQSRLVRLCKDCSQSCAS